MARPGGKTVNPGKDKEDMEDGSGVPESDACGGEENTVNGWLRSV